MSEEECGVDQGEEAVSADERDVEGGEAALLQL